MLMLYRRRWALFYLPVLALAALAVLTASREWFPLPPRSITLDAGQTQGGYAAMAELYRQELERRGIAVELVAATPAPGVLQRMSNAADKVQAGFANGLQAERGPEAPALALAVIGKEPLWIFTHRPEIQSLAMLRGARVAAGPAGSPSRQLANLLLEQAQMQPSDMVWSDDLGGAAAANDLIEKKVDAVITIDSAESPTIRRLMRSPGVYMLGLDRANALARREPRLYPVVLPQGAVELRGDVPPRDLTLLYTSTHLLVRSGTHPALQRALLDAATDIHAVPTFLQRQSEYPDFTTDFPLSPVARRYSAGDRPWAELVLPYWWAQLTELLLFGVLPVLLATLAALLWIPQLISLRVNAVLAHYYGELKFMENELADMAAQSPIDLRNALGKLDAMERQVSSLVLPDRYADRWYTLREHLTVARERLLKLRSR